MEDEMFGECSTHAEWEVDFMWLRNVATSCQTRRTVLIGVSYCVTSLVT